jgi:hypothetical protein
MSFSNCSNVLWSQVSDLRQIVMNPRKTNDRYFNSSLVNYWFFLLFQNLLPFSIFLQVIDTYYQ